MTAIIGGGIGGLSAAYYLLSRRVNQVAVTLLEASDTLGGWVKTIDDPQTGLKFEKGPRTIRPKGEAGLNTLALVTELGLNNEIVSISNKHPGSTNRFIYVNKKLHALPNGFKSIFTIQSPFTKPLLFAMLRDIFKSPKLCQDDSIYNFVERRFGHEIAEYITNPLICGICAGDSKEISVKFLMASLFEYEQKYGSVVKGFWKKGLNELRNLSIQRETNELAKQCKTWSVWRMKNGLQDLIGALNDKVIEREGIIRKKTKINKLIFRDNEVVCRINNEELNFKHIFSAIPAYELSKLIKNEHPYLSTELDKINFVDVAVVNLAYSCKILKNDGFGFLVPPSENIPLLGVIFDSCLFPQNNYTVFTVMLGGRHSEKYQDKLNSEEKIYNTAVSYINEILNVSVKPEASHISVLKKCIPQYVVGHSERIDNINNYIQKCELPLSLIGSSYNGIGINDVIMSSKLAVETYLSKC